jgi:hypothetical protein
MSRKSFLLRIDRQLYDDLEALAHQDMRSVNGQIEYILKQAVTKRLGTSNKIPELSRPIFRSDQDKSDS